MPTLQIVAKSFIHLQLNVCWKGFTRDHDTLEPEKHLKNAKEKIQEYKNLGLQKAGTMGFED